MTNYNVAQKKKIVSDSIESIVGKRDNAAISPFSTISRDFFPKVIYSRDCVVQDKVNKILDCIVKI